MVKVKSKAKKDGVRVNVRMVGLSDNCLRESLGAINAILESLSKDKVYNKSDLIQPVGDLVLKWMRDGLPEEDDDTKVGDLKC